jgi:hypothetical protein
MITIYDDETLAAARAAITDRDLATLLDRIEHAAKASNLWELTYILIADRGDDDLDELESILGFDPLAGPLDDDVEEFTPYWASVECHRGWIELLHVTGTDFAYYILIPTQAEFDGKLAALCRGFRP